MKYASVFILIWIFYINGINGQQSEEIGIQDIPNFITSNETYHVISGADLEIVCQVTQSNVDIIISYESFDSQHSRLKIEKKCNKKCLFFAGL